MCAYTYTGACTYTYIGACITLSVCAYTYLRLCTYTYLGVCAHILWCEHAIPSAVFISKGHKEGGLHALIREMATGALVRACPSLDFKGRKEGGLHVL